MDSFYKPLDTLELSRMVWIARVKRFFEEKKLYEGNNITFDTSDPVALSVLFSEIIPCLDYIEARYNCRYIYQEQVLEFLVDLVLPSVSERSYEIETDLPEGVKISFDESDGGVFLLSMIVTTSAESFTEDFSASHKCIKHAIARIVRSACFNVWLPDYKECFRYTYDIGDALKQKVDIDDFPFVLVDEGDVANQNTHTSILLPDEAPQKKIIDALVCMGVDRSHIYVEGSDFASLSFGQYIPGLMFRIDYMLFLDLKTRYASASAILRTPAIEGDPRHTENLIDHINNEIDNSNDSRSLFLDCSCDCMKWVIGVYPFSILHHAEKSICNQVNSVKEHIAELAALITQHCLTLYEEGELTSAYTFAGFTADDLICEESDLILEYEAHEEDDKDPAVKGSILYS